MFHFCTSEVALSNHVMSFQEIPIHFLSIAAKKSFKHLDRQWTAPLLQVVPKLSSFATSYPCQRTIEVGNGFSVDYHAKIMLSVNFLSNSLIVYATGAPSSCVMIYLFKWLSSFL